MHCGWCAICMRHRKEIRFPQRLPCSDGVASSKEELQRKSQVCVNNNKCWVPVVYALWCCVQTVTFVILGLKFKIQNDVSQ